jgi:hypothetical protein
MAQCRPLGETGAAWGKHVLPRSLGLLSRTSLCPEKSSFQER